VEGNKVGGCPSENKEARSQKGGKTSKSKAKTTHKKRPGPSFIGGTRCAASKLALEKKNSKRDEGKKVEKKRVRKRKRGTCCPHKDVSFGLKKKKESRARKGGSTKPRIERGDEGNLEVSHTNRTQENKTQKKGRSPNGDREAEFAEPVREKSKV